MARRVENIILVSSMYDTFILQEDGQLSELMLGEFLDLNLHHTTGLTHVSSGAEAIALAKAREPLQPHHHAVNLGDMNAAELAREGAGRPAWTSRWSCSPIDGGELAEFMARHDISGIERIFLWQGDPRILLAIIKYVEDKLNVAYDAGVAGVQVILLIEDNIRYYSSFLPLIYTEVIRHSQTLISRGRQHGPQDPAHAGPPKILLCATSRRPGSTSPPTRRTPGRHLRHRVPPGGRARPRGRLRVRPPGQAGLAGHPRAAAVEPAARARPWPARWGPSSCSRALPLC